MLCCRGEVVDARSGGGAAVAATFSGINGAEGTVGDVVSVAVGMMREVKQDRSCCAETESSESHAVTGLSHETLRPRGSQALFIYYNQLHRLPSSTEATHFVDSGRNPKINMIILIGRYIQFNNVCGGAKASWQTAPASLPSYISP